MISSTVMLIADSILNLLDGEAIAYTYSELPHGCFISIANTEPITQIAVYSFKGNPFITDVIIEVREVVGNKTIARKRYSKIGVCLLKRIRRNLHGS